MPPCPPVYSLYPRAPVSSTAMSHLVSDDPLHLQFLQRSVGGFCLLERGGGSFGRKKGNAFGKKKVDQLFCRFAFQTIIIFSPIQNKN